MINLGDEVIDKVTGFTGIATARHTYLNGCARISVQPKVTDDMKLPESCTFDEPQLEVRTQNVVRPSNNNTGGPEKYMPKERSTG